MINCIIRASESRVARRCLATTYLFMCPPFYLYILTAHVCVTMGRSTYLTVKFLHQIRSKITNETTAEQKKNG